LEDKVIIYFIQSDGSRRARPMKSLAFLRLALKILMLIAFVDLGLIRRLNNWESGEIEDTKFFLRTTENPIL
jgi:hypothetical protein